MSEQTSQAPQSFESALAEIEALVRRMEDGRLPLEQALAAYERGTVLLKYCQDALNAAEQKLQVLEAGKLSDLVADGDPEARDA